MTKLSKDPRRPKRRRSELERLVDLTVLGPTHPELGTCWLFTGATTPYGRIAKAQDSYTHRLGWKLLRGPIPEGKELHHRCGVYACWNPDHLQVVTHAENLAFKRETHCKHGHALSGATYGLTLGREREHGAAASLGRPGKPGRPSGRPRTDMERLLDDTVLGQPHPDLGACWLFTGPADPYGRIDRASERYAHRLGWKLLRGPIPDDMELHHRCGVHTCWNPDHLVVVTHAENMAFAARTHCKNGHPLSGANLRIDPQTGTRACRACGAEHQRAFRKRQAAKRISRLTE